MIFNLNIIDKIRAISGGGTGANNASDARKNLGFTYGTDEPTEAPTTGNGSVHFKTGGSDEADYIVETGTGGIWTYRKWSSGVAECWGYWTAQNASGKRSALEIQLPFAFSSTEYNVGISLGQNGSTISGIFGDFDVAANRQHTTTSFIFSWIGSDTYSVGFYFDVKGRWK